MIRAYSQLANSKCVKEMRDKEKLPLLVLINSDVFPQIPLACCALNLNSHLPDGHAQLAFSPPSRRVN